MPTCRASAARLCALHKNNWRKFGRIPRLLPSRVLSTGTTLAGTAWSVAATATAPAQTPLTNDSGALEARRQTLGDLFLSTSNGAIAQGRLNRLFSVQWCLKTTRPYLQACVSIWRQVETDNNPATTIQPPLRRSSVSVGLSVPTQSPRTMGAFSTAPRAFLPNSGMARQPRGTT